MFDAPAGQDPDSWPLVADIDEEFYIKPDAGRLMGSPADETPVPPQDIQPDELDIAVAADRIMKATTIDIRRIHNKWAGLRSFVKDKSLVAGFDADRPGFFWLAGQGGYGIQTAPAMARVAAALATDADFPEHAAAKGVSAADLDPARLR
jgi:D-arginine dehydrogenase